MTNAKQTSAATQAKVLACMTPGTTYTVPQIARLLGTGSAEAQRLLAGCVARGKVKESRDGKRAAYRQRTEEDLHREREQAERHAFPPGELQGYDAAMRRFRDMCMATRRSLSGSPNGNGDSEPHD